MLLQMVGNGFPKTAEAEYIVRFFIQANRNKPLRDFRVILYLILQFQKKRSFPRPPLPLDKEGLFNRLHGGIPDGRKQFFKDTLPYDKVIQQLLPALIVRIIDMGDSLRMRH